ncbi:MAG: 1-(5-phosphoribosyl)-5-[Clostridia bacterium]|nr:1-(5-phosphoribosyl)-5-[(5-phosphoribosylamino)methylideneamino]imidazole-4-carboxamide isomerase [Clostridia bacterium]
MKIFPAIDLYDGKVVRLYKGRYDEMTVYSDNPLEIAKKFEQAGAEYIHIVDLEGAKDGLVHAFETVKSIIENTSLNVEIGGGIRTEETIKRYVDLGVDKVILGTIAVTDEEFLSEMSSRYRDKIAVGVDLKDGYVAIKGWTEKSQMTADEMLTLLASHSISRVICTDISRDGAMKGTNRELYKQISDIYCLNVVASGGVSSLDDIEALNNIGLYGAIIGKAYYTGAIDLKEAIRISK